MVITFNTLDQLTTVEVETDTPHVLPKTTTRKAPCGRTARYRKLVKVLKVSSADEDTQLSNFDIETATRNAQDIYGEGFLACIEELCTTCQEAEDSQLEQRMKEYDVSQDA